MTIARAGKSVSSMVAAAALLAAVPTTWLVITNPWAVAEAVARREAHNMVTVFASLIVDLVGYAVRWL